MPEFMLLEGGKAPQAKRDYSNIPLPALAGGIYDAERMLADADAKHREQTASLRDEVREMRDFLGAQMAAKNAKVLAHDDLLVTYEQRTELVKHIDELRSLEGLVPADELEKGLYVEVTASMPPHFLKPVMAALGVLVAADKIKIFWKADAMKLKPLARFGDDVRAILDKALLHSPVGQPVLKIEPKDKPPRNVTPHQDGLAQK